MKKLILLCLIIFICGCNKVEVIKLKENTQIVVNIYGAINKPGRYLIDKQGSINDVIELASGYQKYAQKLENKPLTNNQSIYVYDQRIKTRININQASSQTLSEIKGIGPKMANEIINYRKANGEFKTMEQIMEVKGIKLAKFNKIGPYLSIS